MARIVTVARFEQAAQAHVAKNALEDAGIRAVIADETVVSMDWFLSNAVGGIKVQVLEEDAARTVAVLEEALGSDAEPVDEEAFTAEAEAAEPEDAADAAERPPTPVSDPVADAVAREKDARFALLAVCFGCVIPFGHLFALVMIVKACSGPGELSRQGRYHVYAAVLIFALVYLPLLVLVLSLASS